MDIVENSSSYRYNNSGNFELEFQKFNVKSFIAISTDKAAPPFNNIYSLSKL